MIPDVTDGQDKRLAAAICEIAKRCRLKTNAEAHIIRAHSLTHTCISEQIWMIKALPKRVVSDQDSRHECTICGRAL